MNIPKVKNTFEYKGKIVCKGVLIMMQSTEGINIPIVISADEEYTEEDYVFNPHSKLKCADDKWSNLVKASDCDFLFPYKFRSLGNYKVLVHSEWLPLDTLYQIDDNKLRSGDRVYVECKVNGTDKLDSVYINNQNEATIFNAEYIIAEEFIKLFKKENEYSFLHSSIVDEHEVAEFLLTWDNREVIL